MDGIFFGNEVERETYGVVVEYSARVTFNVQSPMRKCGPCWTGTVQDRLSLLGTMFMCLGMDEDSTATGDDSLEDNYPPQPQTTSTLKDDPPQPLMTSFRHPSLSARPTSIPSTAISADSIFELSSFTSSQCKWAMWKSGVENKGRGENMPTS
ncbi:hypothetical protein EDD85DRAFT_218911 [Armillaria nabsnona]|nr:hypothetical protein EDD85DRAFT_218911 [Armillaria nabsnona]